MRDVDIEFRCPDCAGSWFRSDFSMKDGKIVEESMTGQCTSPDESGNQGCGFEWHRSEDWKYWVEVRSFESEAEYQAAMGIRDL